MTAVINRAIADMNEQGAIIIDPDETPPQDLIYRANVDTRYEFERDLEKYLATRGPEIPDSLEKIIKLRTVEQLYKGQYPDNPITETLQERVEVEVETLDENADYLIQLAAKDDLQEQVLLVMANNDLDALLYPSLTRTPYKIGSDRPSGTNCSLSVGTLFPSITVPAGFTDEKQLPVGVELLARPFEEPLLIELAYSYEQATMRRQTPEEFGPLNC